MDRLSCKRLPAGFLLLHGRDGEGMKPGTYTEVPAACMMA